MGTRTITTVGMVITVGYVAWLGYYVSTAWPEIVKLAPNTMGDFLAGVFGPLALMWLICGYFQQGVELRLNTEALRLQATELENSTRALEHQVEELKKSVDQQTILAEATQKQLAIEVERHERVKRQEKLQNMADLQISAYDKYGLRAPKVGRIAISNSGAPITITEIESDSKDDTTSMVSELGTGDGFWILPARDDRKDICFTIRYRMRNGAKGEYELRMTLLEDKTYSAELVRTSGEDD